MKNYLNFETEIKDLENELEKLKDPYNQEGLSEVDTQKISSTQNEIDEKLKNIYSNLDPWQTTMVARHEDRPKAKFFIDNLFDDFISLSGDRYYGEDKSVLTGFAKFNNFSATCRLLILMYFSCIALKFVPHLYFCLRALLLRRKSISFQSVMLQSVLLPESFRGGCSFGAINSLSR